MRPGPVDRGRVSRSPACPHGPARPGTDGVTPDGVDPGEPNPGPGTADPGTVDPGTGPGDEDDGRPVGDGDPGTTGPADGNGMNGTSIAPLVPSLSSWEPAVTAARVGSDASPTRRATIST